MVRNIVVGRNEAKHEKQIKKNNNKEKKNH